MKIVKKRKEFKLLFSLVLGILVILSFLFLNNIKTKEVKADAEDNVYGYAWSENIVWISFNSTNTGSATDYGVNIDASGIISGYAWSENIGWISFDQTGGCPSGSSCQAKIDPSTYEVSGWARALAYGDGWDGWIRLDGVKLNEITKEFEGWAWGSDVVGWISFNCKDTGICPTSDYKVQTSVDFNFSPYNPDSLKETWNNCWRISPQVALGTSISFEWTYSDPEGDPQKGYEIWVDSDPNFPGEKFNHIVLLSQSNSYALNLDDDDNNDWDSKLSWSSNYWWKVRVKDTGSGEWSEWSDPNMFRTNDHASPYADFGWFPSLPSMNEIFQLCAVQTGICSSINEKSICYNSADEEISCSGKSFLWTLPDEADFASTSIESTENPQIKFIDSGNYDVKLEITDDVGSCDWSIPIQVTFPLPEWEETTP